MKIKCNIFINQLRKMVFIHFLLYIDRRSRECMCFIKGTEFIFVGLENKVQGSEQQREARTN